MTSLFSTNILVLTYKFLKTKERKKPFLRSEPNKKYSLSNKPVK